MGGPGLLQPRPCSTPGRSTGHGIPCWKVPDTVEGLRALPGIGAYTAGAIASIAFGIPAPAVDGNVRA